MTHLPPMSGLLALQAVVRRGTLSEAAHALNITQPAISRRIAALEEDLGCRVFDRSARPLRLTTEGQELAGIVESSLSQIETTAFRLRNRSSRGRVTISGPSGLIAFWMMPLLADLSEAFPHEKIRVISSENDPSARPGDIDIRFGAPDNGGSHASNQPIKILGEEVFLAASPFYLSTRGTPASLEDLRNHILLTMDGGVNWYDWPDWFKGINAPVVSGRREIEFSSYATLVGALLAGQGIALAWSGLLDSFFKSGALEPIGTHRLSSDRGYFLTVREDTSDPETVAEMAAWIVDHATP